MEYTEFKLLIYKNSLQPQFFKSQQKFNLFILGVETDFKYVFVKSTLIRLPSETISYFFTEFLAMKARSASDWKF